jgi:predicted secreted Zn-dependent protease
MKRLVLAASCLAFAAPGPATAEPVVKRNVVHYEVDGATAQAIRAELSRLGPIGRIEKRRFDAHTLWNVKWTYRFRNVGQECAVARVTVSIDITMTVPRLKPNGSRPDEVTRAFEEFAKALLAHEEGHAENGIDAARRIEAAIRDMQPKPTLRCAGPRRQRAGRRPHQGSEPQGSRLRRQYPAWPQPGRPLSLIPLDPGGATRTLPHPRHHAHNGRFH